MVTWRETELANSPVCLLAAHGQQRCHVECHWCLAMYVGLSLAGASLFLASIRSVFYFFKFFRLSGTDTPVGLLSLGRPVELAECMN